MMIRPANENDIDFLKKGLLDVRTIEKRPQKDIPLTSEDVDSFLMGIRNGNISMIDDIDGKPAAFIYYRTDFPIPYVHGEYLWIDILYVRVDQRGKGFGKALYGHVTEIARKMGLDKIVIDIFDPNERSKIFHGGLDFKPFYTIYTKNI